MTQDEIRRLLGGYATNSLSEGERTALFEAALDDQELFDALQNENALREALADPVTRAQVQAALQPAEPRRSFPWARAWLIGGLATAAAITIAIMIWPRQRERPDVARQAVRAPQQMAQNRVTPKLEAPKLEPSPAAAAPRSRALKPKPLAPRARPLIATAPAELATAATAPARVSQASQPAPKAMLASDAALYQGPLVRYSLIRSGPAGDTIRIEVVSQLPGTLALYQRDAEGQWQRVYPANAPNTTIAANTPYQIPEEPITVRGPQKLRLVVEPAGPRYEAQLAAGSLNQPRARPQRAIIAPPPLVVEIPIGPN